MTQRKEGWVGTACPPAGAERGGLARPEISFSTSQHQKKKTKAAGTEFLGGRVEGSSVAYSTSSSPH